MNKEVQNFNVAERIRGTYANFRVLADIPTGDCDSIRTHLGMIRSNISHLEELNLYIGIVRYAADFDRKGLEKLIETAKKNKESYDLKYGVLSNARVTIAQSDSEKVGEIISFMDNALLRLPELNDKFIETAERYLKEIHVDD